MELATDPPPRLPVPFSSRPRKAMSEPIFFPENPPPSPVLKSVSFSGARIGTCGEPKDCISIGIARVRAIFDLVVQFDGERDGWAVGRQQWEGDDWTFLELAFIPNDDLEWPEGEMPITPDSEKP